MAGPSAPPDRPRSKPAVAPFGDGLCIKGTSGIENLRGRGRSFRPWLPPNSIDTSQGIQSRAFAAGSPWSSSRLSRALAPIRSCRPTAASGATTSKRLRSHNRLSRRLRCRKLKQLGSYLQSPWSWCWYGLATGSPDKNRSVDNCARAPCALLGVKQAWVVALQMPAAGNAALKVGYRRALTAWSRIRWRRHRLRTAISIFSISRSKASIISPAVKSDKAGSGICRVIFWRYVRRNSCSFWTCLSDTSFN